MSDYSLDIAVAQAVEPMPPPPVNINPDYVIWSPMLMWVWRGEASAWAAGTFQDSIGQAMRAYELYFRKTGWRMVELRHRGGESWAAYLYKSSFTSDPILKTGEGSTAAIAICEAIRAADAERATLETGVRG